MTRSPGGDDGLGADDYVVKPFSPRELARRVASVLRRVTASPPTDEPALRFDGLEIDERTREVRVDGEPVELTRREFDLLVFLARSPRQVFNRAQLLSHVWDSSPEWQDPATVTVHVGHLRQKLEPDPGHPRWLVTVRGARLSFVLGGLLARRGYQFLGVDRPGHGLSDGPRGDCTVEEAIAVTDAAIEHARTQWGHPVVLMGSSLGGLLAMFAVLHGLQPDAAVAHSFVYPGKLISLRLRAVDRPLPRPPLSAGQAGTWAGHALRRSGGQRLDPRPRRSRHGVGAKRPQHREPVRLPRAHADRCPALPGAQRRPRQGHPSLGHTAVHPVDTTAHTELRVIPDAGHHLFLDQLDRCVPLIADWLEARLAPTS